MLQRQNETQLELQFPEKAFASLRTRDAESQSTAAVPKSPPSLVQKDVIHVLRGADGSTAAGNAPCDITCLCALR